jgi:Ser/Thr protein kinase RdoA (MazF antagonist)
LVDPASSHAPPNRPTLVELQSVADSALAEYGIASAEFENLRYYNNATYRVVAADLQQYVLRITSNHYSEAELASEMQYLRALQDEPGLLVPAPVAARDGRLVVSASAPTLTDARRCNLFRWIEGSHVSEAQLTGDHFSIVGAATARLHRRSCAFGPSIVFGRPRWDETHLLKAEAVDTYARILAHLRGYFAKEMVDRFIDLTEQGRALMRARRSDPQSYGMIHGDFHPGNCLFQGDRVAFIDFEDFGWGYFLYDIATALFGVIEEPYYRTFTDNFIAAYAQHRPLPESLADELLLFQVQRVVFLTSLVVARGGDLAESRWWQGYVVGKLQRILSDER